MARGFARRSTLRRAAMIGKAEKSKATKESEYRSDAWERFEQAVDVALHTPAKSHASPKKKRAKTMKAREPWD